MSQAGKLRYQQRIEKLYWLFETLFDKPFTIVYKAVPIDLRLLFTKVFACAQSPLKGGMLLRGCMKQNRDFHSGKR